MRLTLSQLLQSLRIARVDSAFIELGAYTGVQLHTARRAFIHICLEGEVWLEEAGSTSALRLTPGDYAAQLRGPRQYLRSSEEAPVRPSSYFAQASTLDTPATLRFGSGPRAARVLTGGFHVVRGHPLLRALPASLLVRFADQKKPGFLPIAPDVFADAAIRAGGAAFVTGSFDLLFLQAVRNELFHLLQSGLEAAGAMHDLRIPIVLSLLHSHPDRPWTLAMMAAEIGVSRSTLAAEFHETVGQPFLQYLTSLRMARASEMLKWQPATVGEVAYAVGYRSVASFTRAFRQFFQTTPAAYRARQVSYVADSVGGHMHWSPFLPIDQKFDPGAG